MNKKIPTYTVCGFLESGKTSFINKCIKNNINYGVIQFENGNTDVILSTNIKVLKIPFRNIGSNIAYTSELIFEFITSNSFDEIWIEINGVMEKSIIDKIFFNYFDNYSKLSDFLNFKKTVYINSNKVESLLKGSIDYKLINQILISDVAICEKTKENFIKSINTSIKTFHPNTEIKKILNSKNLGKFIPVISICLMFGLYFLISTNVSSTIIPINYILTILTGIVLQSFPFLLLGVIISSMIQIFLPSNFIERFFPKDPLLGIIFASFVGFIFPVCDCATIPVFRSLVRKGVPLSAAISFMIATPVINPIVIISTLSAYNGNWKIVILRCGLGLVISMIIGLIFHSTHKEKDIYNNKYASDIAYNVYSNEYDSTIVKFIKHTQGEFLNVAKFLVFGAFISSIAQTYFSKINWSSSAFTTLSSILIMMLMGFLLSLCSSSDVVVGRSFGANMPFIAILAFLIYGPMIDLKNIIMLSSTFSKKFILKLTLVVTFVCLAVILMLAFI